MRIADIDQPMWDLLFTVRLSIRYHDRRRRFFASLQRITAAVNMMFGSAAVATFAGLLDHSFGIVSAAIIATLSALELVIGYGSAANLHHDLRRRFIELEQQIMADATAEKLAQYQRQKLDIEKDEPPVRHALNSLSYNDVARAEYPPAEAPLHLIHVPVWQRMTAQLF